jgi:hypothetical protein
LSVLACVFDSPRSSTEGNNHDTTACPDFRESSTAGKTLNQGLNAFALLMILKQKGALLNPFLF